MATCPDCGSSRVLTVPVKAVAGATVGGAVGSAVPVIGTAFGALVGGVIGGVSSLTSKSRSYGNTCAECKKTWVTSSED